MSGARRRFRFIREIAEGGFGKVYLAEQISADGFSRIVAIKLLHAKWSSHDEVVMRTRDEARLLGLIRHQNIVKVDDLTSIDGKCALVMEYLEGVDLKGMMGFLHDKGQQFPGQALFEILGCVVSALDAAYNGVPLQGGEPLHVIHRDIKPSNVFITVPGSVKLLDFGTSRANFAEREAKTMALAFGSQGYMAPERMLGEEDTPAGDIFSLGITLYELLALESFGRVPPRPTKFTAKLDERINALPSHGSPEWDQKIRSLIREMMSYEPTDRPSAQRLIEVFDTLAEEGEGMSLRRFCRIKVAEARAGEAEIESEDPLTGRLLDEDFSTTFSMDLEGRPQMPSDPDSEENDDSDVAPPPPPTRSQPAAPSVASGPYEADEDLEETAGSKKMLVVGLLATGFGLLLLLLVAVVVGVVVMKPSTNEAPSDAVAQEAPGKEKKDQAARTTTNIPAAKKKEPRAEEAAPASTGEPGKIVARDTRAGIAQSRSTKLSALGQAAKVRIRGGVGFEAEWDGSQDFDLGPLPAGKYRADLTPAGGKKIRNRSFEVEAKKRCSWTFSWDEQQWQGGCS